jgi:penicillin-binding protein 1C
MKELERPGIENSWRNFSSSKHVAWKTGTSFGFRDAWAVGITEKYVIAVWCGNADGEGRPGLVGAKAAGPILFDIVNTLNTGNDWYYPPYDDMEEVILCKNSGMKAHPNCTDTITVLSPLTCNKRGLCTHCKLEHLDKTKSFRVDNTCYSPAKMKHKSFFELSPTQEWYYEKNHPTFVKVPPFRTGCGTNEEVKQMQLVYPSHGAKIFIPRDVDGQKSDAIFEVSHKQEDTKVYWHVDDEYLGETTDFHEFLLRPTTGHHTLTVVDSKGESISVNFEIVN